MPSWATETRRWNAWLHAQCDQGDSAARHWVQQQGPWTQPLISRGLKKALWHFQQGQCYWCRRPMPLREATIEHVIASGSPVWATMQPLEQLLSLRVSHRRCNTAYHHWRRQHRRAARAADWRRMRTIRRMVRQAWLAHERPRLPALWHTTYQRTGDASRADFAVAIRAVSLQLSDAEVMAELQALMTQARARKHRPVERYLTYTVAKARHLTGVVAPGVWVGGQFDPARVPWAQTV